jgi:hypothetical protein
VAFVAEQPGEASPGVEAGEAEPVDRPVPPDQGRGVGVPDEGIVLDGQGHAITLAPPGPTESASMPRQPCAQRDASIVLREGEVLGCAIARSHVGRRNEVGKDETTTTGFVFEEAGRST